VAFTARPPKKRPFKSVNALIADGKVLNSRNIRTASSGLRLGSLFKKKPQKLSIC